LLTITGARVPAESWHFKFAADKEVHNPDRTLAFTLFDAAHKNRKRRNKQQKGQLKTNQPIRKQCSNFSSTFAERRHRDLEARRLGSRSLGREKSENGSPKKGSRFAEAESRH
jgi:hypothetical protein